MLQSIPGIDYRFENPELLQSALTHRSAGANHYERLEFLGDSVLGMLVSARLFQKKPSAPEGDLSRMRARLVRGSSLSEIAASLDLGRWIRLGEGELKSGGFRRSSILADTFEAILGAVYIDGGLEPCRRIVHHHFDPLIEALPGAEDLKDPKTRLQEWLQARQFSLPVYRLEKEEGADHAKTFHVVCVLAEPPLEVRHSGRSRRGAEQAAAQLALETVVAENA